MSNKKDENDNGTNLPIKNRSKSNEFLNSVIKELESRQFNNKPTTNDVSLSSQDGVSSKNITITCLNEQNSRTNSLDIPQPFPRLKKSLPPPPPPQKNKPNNTSQVYSEPKTCFEETKQRDEVKTDIETLLNNAFEDQNKLSIPFNEFLPFDDHRLQNKNIFNDEIVGNSLKNRSCSMVNIDNLDAISCYTFDSIDSEDFLMSPRRQSSSFEYENANANKNKPEKVVKVRKRDKLKEKLKWKTAASKEMLNNSKEKMTDTLLDIANQAGGKLKRLASTRIRSGDSKQRTRTRR